MNKTRKVRLYFYKNSKTFFGKVIRLQQKLQYFFLRKNSIEKFTKFSHMEIAFCNLTISEEKKIIESGCFHDWESSFCDSKIKNDRLSSCETEYFEEYNHQVFFSSSEHDKGTRFKLIEPKEKNWEFVEIEVTEEQYRIMLEEAHNLSGQPYGTWGIFFQQALNWNLKDSFLSRMGIVRGLFCTETCMQILHKAYGTGFSNRVYGGKFDGFFNPLKSAIVAHKEFKFIPK